MKCNYLEEETCIKIGNIPKIFCWVTVLPARKFTTLSWYMYEMSIQKNKIRKYSSHTNSLNVGIYNQNWLSKVIQIYRERYLYVWQTREHEIYLLVSFERGPILIINICMIKHTHMDGHTLFCPPPVFLLTVITHLYLGLLPDITEILLLVLSKAVKENPSPLSCRDPCSGLVLLEESLICRRSQRLVSRRNMVPML